MDRQSPLKAPLHKRLHSLPALLPFLAAFCTASHPAYACADVGAGIGMIIGIIGGGLFLPLITGGLLVAACDKLVFSGYGLLMAAGTFVITAPPCIELIFSINAGSGHRNFELPLLLAPSVLSVLLLFVMSWRETKKKEAQTLAGCPE